MSFDRDHPSHTRSSRDQLRRSLESGCWAPADREGAKALPALPATNPRRYGTLFSGGAILIGLGCIALFVLSVIGVISYAAPAGLIFLAVATFFIGGFVLSVVRKIPRNSDPPPPDASAAATDTSRLPPSAAQPPPGRRTTLPPARWNMALFAVVAVFFAASAVRWGIDDEVGKSIGAGVAALALVGCFLLAHRRGKSERPRQPTST